jgi:hypothetical protein
MDKCSIDLLRILSLLGLQYQPPGLIAVLLSDIPATIIFASARAGDDQPLRGNIFREIVQHVGLVRNTEATHQILLQEAPQINVPAALHEYGTDEYSQAARNNATRLIAQSQILKETADLIQLVMAFIEEWSDILSGVDVLDGCCNILDPNPYVEQIDVVWKIGLEFTNKLGSGQKAQLTRAMPNFFTAEYSASDNTELSWYNGTAVCSSLFMKRERIRSEQITFATVRSQMESSRSLLVTDGVDHSLA